MDVRTPLKRLGAALAAVPRWLWYALAVTFTVLLLLAGRGGGAARTALARRTRRAYNTAQGHREDSRAALEALAEQYEATDREVDSREAEARMEAHAEAMRPRHPGPRDLILALLAPVLLTVGVPSTAEAQSTSVITPYAVALQSPARAEVPTAPVGEQGPCVPGTGRWPGPEGSRCYPCPDLSRFALGAGDLPEGCPSPLPGVLLTRAEEAEVVAELAGLRQRADDLAGALGAVRAQVWGCELARERLATETADALEACVEVVDEGDGYGLATVAGVGLVGAAIGVLIGALAL